MTTVKVLEGDPRERYTPALARDLLAIQAALAAVSTPPTNPVLAWLTEVDGSLLIGVPDGPAAMRIERRASQANLTLLGGAKSYGGGIGVVLIRNATEAPHRNPTGGGLLYVERGDLTYRGPHGTVTVLACA